MTSSTPASVARLRLAVVEDDEELREKIMLPALTRAGFDVTGLASALQLYRAWTDTTFDLVLLDVGLPDDDGVEIARHLRGLSQSLGIVLYTGHGQSVDRMRGLRAGVDVYLVKPLDMDEVAETLRSVHRRLQGGRSHGDSNGWLLERQGWYLRAPCGTGILLNQGERQVMQMLAASRGEPVSRESLIAGMTGDVGGFDPHRLDMLVYRLRKKCSDAAKVPLPLRAVRGVGYIFDA